MLNDNISPSAIWYGSALFGFISVLGFVLLNRRGNQVSIPRPQAGEQPGMSPDVL
jgi:hypothetical protein